MKNVLFLLLCLLIVGCTNGALSREDYLKLKNSKIVFPKNMEQFSNIKVAKLPTAYKMLVFRDSLACTPCYVKSLDEWKTFVSAFRSNRLSLIFVLVPKQEEYLSVRSVLRARRYNWTILVDKENAFEKTNPQMPKDGIYHCVLLDKNNKVVIIGNPLKNKKVFNMMIDLVNGKINN